MKGLKLRRRWPAAFAGLTLMALVLFAKQHEQSPRFRDVLHLRAWAEDHGFQCQSDRCDGQVANGVAVSTRRLTWEEVGGLDRCVRGPAWDGIAWAINISPTVQTLPWYGECRVWGGVIVTGDPRLLDYIQRGGIYDRTFGSSSQ
jgi:hypothetical protein